MLKLFFSKIIPFVALIAGVFFIFLNFNNIIELSNDRFFYLLLIIALHCIYLFILNYRSYFILKVKLLKNIDLLNWSKIFFKSILIQDTLLSQSGFLYRSIFLRSYGIRYHELSTFFYFGISTHVLTNLIMVLIELNLLNHSNLITIFGQVILVLIILVIIFYIPLVISSIKILFYKFNFYKKLNNFFINILINQSKYFFDIKFLFKVILITICMHLIEISVFYFVFKFLFESQNIWNIIILFGISTITDRIPLISSIPFVRETIFGVISISFGMIFLDGFFIKLIMTFASISGSFLNYSIVSAKGYFFK